MPKIKAKEPNPYRADLLEIMKVQKTDEMAALKLIVALRAKIERDIEEERRVAHSEMMSVLLEMDSPQQIKQLRELTAMWFDIPARRYFFRFAFITDTEGYFGVLKYLVEREAPIWSVFAKVIGDSEVQIIVAGRVSHWKAKALELVRLNNDRASSPESLITSFMERHEIPSFDGRGGFTERLTSIGRDTLFAVRDETRWVKPSNYKTIANFIGCRPEQLHPRIPRPQRPR